MCVCLHVYCVTNGRWGGGGGGGGGGGRTSDVRDIRTFTRYQYRFLQEISQVWCALGCFILIE